MSLKALRNKFCISQKEAATFLKVPLRTYKRYENEKSYISTYKYSWMVSLLKQYKTNSEKNLKHSNSYRISIAGAGYVGLSLACLLDEHHIVNLTDINEERIELINKGISPFHDSLIQAYLNKKHIKVEKRASDSYKDSNYIFIATPTDFNESLNTFDTSNIEDVIDKVLKVNKKATIVIKSTIPLGYTKYLIDKYHYSNILFSPEFLREGHALEDCYYPFRIIVGHENNLNKAKKVMSLLQNASKKRCESIFMSSEEAEASKLFANTYLAMRVAFFNKLDTYSISRHLSSRNIVKGVSLDPRIGDYYNNPSFGYGGYCLPKDTIQLVKSYFDIPNNNLIKAVVESNITRKQYIANDIINTAIKVSRKKKEELTIGVYLVSMKKGSDNARSSSTLDIVNILKNHGIKVLIFDPIYESTIKDFDNFINECDYFIANRIDERIMEMKEKVYTRDLYHRD